jgi:transposase-like protein
MISFRPDGYEIGLVEIDVPRDTDASFSPQIVKKRQRRLTGVDEIVLSLTARSLTTGEISAHFAEGVLRCCTDYLIPDDQRVG